ncbi:AraC family transcriptional regulator [Nocardioides sp. zg-DK7169]|uniref:AraC family transcriptional regulator n=1 Tax=Nocardioides sp. zg-DK7169 TaxID=2736600 RepID=UPI0015561A44|nr:AraC family transcriptional regulator [Nocardioides sp. zg-DK7169]NPC96739.1 AraC family transcriptional regulator [Nocardioides sp. zg-DK7169]
MAHEVGEVDQVSTLRTSDPAAAEAAVAAKYQISNRLSVPSRHRGQFDMQMTKVRIGSSKVGLLSFGADTRVLTGATSGFHINLTLQGRATGARNGAEAETAVAGEGLVYEPGVVTDAFWLGGCRVLTLLLARDIVERELEALLGHSLRAPLRPEAKTGANGLAEALAPVVQLVRSQAARPIPARAIATVQSHVEALIVDSFLLAHRHNYSEELVRPTPSVPRAPIERAAYLLEERPEHPWSTPSLAAEVHLSVRALQDGFKRHHGTPPMTFLRRIRLRRVHAALASAVPGETTVHEVALRHGILHMGRFSAVYHKEYGEHPSVTLRRPVT